MKDDVKANDGDESKQTNTENGPLEETDGAAQPETSDSGIDTAQDESNDPVEALQLQVAELKDLYMRTAAETENIRKRAERERADFIKFGLESFVKDLLPFLDGMDKALPSSGMETEDKAFMAHVEGMNLLKHQLVTILAKHGLEEIDSKGANFDPNIHQAIQRIEDPDVETETVSEEYSKGYSLNGRLVRPAMVSVKVPGDK